MCRCVRRTVLAAVKLEFDVSEASALFPKAKPRSWKVIFKPILWGRRVGGLALAGASPGGAVLHTGAVGRKTERPLFILFYSI